MKSWILKQIIGVLLLSALSCTHRSHSFGQVVVTGNIGATSSVRIDWTASITSSVTYNIYRGENSGGPYTQIITGVTCCTWTDPHVQSKHNYWYVATAFDGSTESSNSNETTEVTVP